MRLDKYVRVSLNISREEARKIIKNKRIKVNNNIETKNDLFLNDDDLVCLDEKELIYKEFYYIMMNKPKDYICANDDKYNKCVVDLIDDFDKESMIIVGRLDIDTTGLLLLTNDGLLSHKLTSPKNNHPKTYYAITDKEFDLDAVNKFKEGITIFLDSLTPYVCKSAVLDIDENNPKNAYITITEGKYHQVKKMCKACGNNVLELKRISIGNIKLDENLELGMYRELTKEEEDILKNI